MKIRGEERGRLVEKQSELTTVQTNMCDGAKGVSCIRTRHIQAHMDINIYTLIYSFTH